MKRRSGIVWIAVLLLLAALVYLFRSRIHFDWSTFWVQLQHISLWRFALAIALNWSTYWLRAWRWSVFLSPRKKVPFQKLVAPQFIGFAAVALFGRLADLTRPYLIARRVEYTISSQIAVYTIERMFDLGAAAIIFSGAMAFTPGNLPHHELFVRVGVGSLVVTLALALFAVAVRVAGEKVAGLCQSILGRLSKPLGESIATKIVSFRDGLDTLASVGEFLKVLVISLAMWGIVAFAYMNTTHAFQQTPQLANLDFSRTMLLMAASIGSGLLTLPVIGWFTQIAATAAAMQAFYGAPIESATACGAILLVVTTLSIIPPGLLLARFGQVSLRQVAQQSKQEGAEENAAPAA